MSDKKPCDSQFKWFGLKCDSSGRILIIELPYNSLTGRLPAELSLLTEIELLDFYWNWIFNVGQKQASWLGDIGDIGKFKCVVEGSAITFRLLTYPSPDIEYLYLGSIFFKYQVRRLSSLDSNRSRSVIFRTI
jgi:hypothetical protein